MELFLASHWDGWWWWWIAFVLLLLVIPVAYSRGVRGRPPPRFPHRRSGSTSEPAERELAARSAAADRDPAWDAFAVFVWAVVGIALIWFALALVW